MTRRAAWIVAVVLALAALPLVARAESIALADGRKIDGRVVSIDADRATIGLTGASGTATFSKAELEKHAWFDLRSRALAKDDARGRIELARAALADDLLTQAKRTAETARALDPSVAADADAIAAEVDARLPDALLAWAERLERSGDHAGARREYSRVATSAAESRAAAIARERLESLDASADASMSAMIDAKRIVDAADLGPLSRSLARARELDRRGLAAGSNQSRALDAFDKAVDVGTTTLARIENLIASERSDATRMTLTALAGEVRAQTVQSLRNAASVLAVRGSHPAALEKVAKAIALDPGNESLRADRARIETAASQRFWRRLR